MTIHRRQLVILLGGLVAACSTSQHEKKIESPESAKTGTAKSAVNAVGPIDPDHGFPRYYEDVSGARVQPCIDGKNDPNCILAANPGVYDITQDTVFSTNFPDEFFYAYAVSDKLSTPGCGAIAPGKTFALTALEGAFTNGLPVAGDQIVFGRIRVVASGLCANTPYDFTHPYGTERVTTNALGQVTANVKGFTQDIGCLGAPCNFSLPFSAPIAGPPPSTGSRVFNTFARWDPAVAPFISGYFGDAATLHPIVGTPNNSFTVRSVNGAGAPPNSGPIITDVTGAIPVTTANFVVAGKLAGDLNAPLLGFSAQAVAVTSAPRTVTVTNWSQSSMSITAAALAGVDAADYAITADTCSGTVVARDGTCTITATFTPSAAGKRNAQIDVTATRLDGVPPLPLSIPLQGTGIVAGALAAVSLSTPALAYGNVRVRAISNPQIVTLTNTGNAPMQVLSVANTGPNAGDFQILQDTCSNKFLDPNMSCFVSTRVSPAASGARSSSLVFTDDAPGSPHTVALTATGTGGLAARSPGVSLVHGFPDWYQDDNGAQVVPCLDQIPDPANPGFLLPDPLCVMPLPPDPWDGTIPIAFPGSFPGESFYYAATSDKLNLPGCPAAGIPAGSSVYLAGLEATFLTGVPIAGDQITFGRKRFMVKGGLCPNTSYTFTHPYGVDVLITDAAGGVKANRKIDTGCLATPCAFTEALADPVFASMLRWDPLVAPASPPGYLGDPTILHTIIGGVYTAPNSLTPVDYYQISAMDGTVIASTNLWSLSGKTAVVRGAPQPVAFPARSVGGVGPAQTLTLTNVDPANAHTVTSISLGGTNPADFATSNDTCTGAVLAACPQPASGLPPVACPATASCTVGVSFTPLALGNRESALIGNHSSASQSPMTVLLTGLGGTPGLSFTPGGGVLFDDQQQNTDSYPHDVTVHNTGNAPLNIPAAAVTKGGPHAAEFEVSSDGCSGTSVPAGGSCSINVTFSPSIIGTLSGTLTVASNAPGNPHTLSLSGKSLTPAVGIASPNPTSIAFGSILRGTRSDASPVVITNVGAAPLAIHHLAVVGQHAGDFALANDMCTGAAPIPVGSTCSFSAVFAPTLPGGRSGVVNIYDSTGNNTLATVALSGTGLAPTIANVAVPAFGGAAGVLFNTTVSQTITVTNSGTGDLIIPAGGLTITGANAASYAISATTCIGAAVAPAASCTVTIGFTPPTIGAKPASLSIQANTVVPTTTFALNGTGLAPALAFSANPMTFGNQRVNTTTTKGLNITNTGTAPLTIGAAGVRVTPAAQFSVVAGSSNKCTSGTVIQPGKSCSLNVTFAPTAAGGPVPGLRAGTLSAASNDPAGVAGERTVGLSGNATP